MTRYLPAFVLRLFFYLFSPAFLMITLMVITGHVSSVGDVIWSIFPICWVGLCSVCSFFIFFIFCSRSSLPLRTYIHRPPLSRHYSERFHPVLAIPLLLVNILMTRFSNTIPFHLHTISASIVSGFESIALLTLHDFLMTERSFH